MRYARGVGGTVAVQAIGLLFAAAGTILLARVLGPEGKGYVSFALFVGTVAGFLLTIGLDAAGTYYAAVGRGEEAEGRPTAFPPVVVASTTLVAAAGLGGAGAAALLVARLAAGPWAILPDAHLAAAAVVLAVFPVAVCGRGVAFGVGRIAAANWNGVLPALLSVPLLAGAALSGILTPRTALALYAAVHAATAAAAAVLSRPSARPRAAYLRAAAPYGLAAYVAAAAGQAHLRLDALLLGPLAGPAAVGLYGAATVLGEALWILPNAASWLLVPRVAADRSEAAGLAPAAARTTLAATAAAAVLLAAAAAPLLALLFGPAFAAAAPALLLLLPGLVAAAHGRVAGAALAGLGDPRPLARAACAGLALNAALNLLLIPPWGIRGAAVASSVSYLLQSALLAVELARRAAIRPVDLLLPRPADLIALLRRR